MSLRVDVKRNVSSAEIGGVWWSLAEFCGDRWNSMEFGRVWRSLKLADSNEDLSSYDEDFAAIEILTKI